MFSKLYNVLGRQVTEEIRTQWLEMATLGANFLSKFGRDEEGNWYFSLTKDGRPISGAHSIFSDCFAAMAFAQYSKASNSAWALNLAKSTFANIEKRKSNPKGKYNKSVPGTRPLESLAVPMIDINLCTEMKEAIPDLDLDVESRIDANLALILEKFHNKEFGYFQENISTHGIVEDADTFEGRLINPGHTIECIWFIMDIAAKRGDRKLVELMAASLLKTIKFGWDDEFGGIFYFLDSKGKPPQQLEWDQKLWWVHLETLVALALALRETGRKEFADWFDKIHTFSWQHFSDKQFGGDWFGYLNRRGEVLLQLKGGKWKGFFHVPRAFWLCSEIFKDIASSFQGN